VVGGVSTISAVAPNGPRDDFHNQRTQHAEFGMSENPPTNRLPTPGPPDESEQPENVDPFDQETEPTPWYRKPALLIAWLACVVILIGLIVFGIIELVHGEPSTGRVPKTTTSTTPTTTTSTTSTTTTIPPTTTTTTPSSSTEVAPPAQQPTQQPTQQQTQQPTHHHHLPPLPPVITIPQVPTVITVPPGLR
jgi:hypothetical protein